MITKELLKSAKPKPRVYPIELEEMGITVYIKSPTSADELAPRNTDDLFRHQICLCLCDEEGNSVVSYPEDVDVFDDYPLTELRKIFEAINDISTLKGKVNAAKKN